MKGESLLYKIHKQSKQREKLIETIHEIMKEETDGKGKK